MQVHRVEAGQHGAEIFRTDRNHGGEAHRGADRVAAADPVPQAEAVGRCDAKGGNAGGVCRDRDKVPGQRALVAQRVQAPGPCRRGVGHGLGCGEGFRADHEQRFGRVQATRRRIEFGAIRARNKAEGQVALAVLAQGLMGHHRAQVRPADAEVDDIADALAGVPAPGAAAHLQRKCRHAFKHRVHLARDVEAVDDDALALGRAQCRMQGGALLGQVDRVTAEHRRDPFPQAARGSQIDQEPPGFAGDAVFRVVEVDAGRFSAKTFAAPAVVRKQLPQVGIANRIEVGSQRLPLEARCEHLWPR